MDEEFVKGDIVLSKSGHDKNRPFIVVDIDKFGFVAIIDGRYRERTKPKIKNPKHLVKIGHDDEILKKVASKVVTEAEIYKMIKKYNKEL